MMKQYQFVWWGFERTFAPPGFISFTRFPGQYMGRIYKWSLWLGPLEIRRWA